VALLDVIFLKQPLQSMAGLTYYLNLRRGLKRWQCCTAFFSLKTGFVLKHKAK
jgi:hypothetical protein